MSEHVKDCLRCTMNICYALMQRLKDVLHVTDTGGLPFLALVHVLRHPNGTEVYWL